MTQAFFLIFYRKGVIQLICTTVKKGVECPFMNAKGCSYNGGICHEVVEQCNGCNRTAEFSSKWYCTACPDPSLKWKTGDCNFASHVIKASSTAKAKINPLKASKRRNR
jgi:hypothetical protein